MEKVVFLGMKKEMKERQLRNGTVVKEREVFFAWPREGCEGYAPRVKSGISKTGNGYGIASTSISEDVFKGYIPKPLDLVYLEYGPYNRIVGITKAQ